MNLFLIAFWILGHKLIFTKFSEGLSGSRKNVLPQSSTWKRVLAYPENLFKIVILFNWLWIQVTGANDKLSIISITKQDNLPIGCINIIAKIKYIITNIHPRLSYALYNFFRICKNSPHQQRNFFKLVTSLENS